MDDHIIRATVDEGSVRVFIADTTNLVNEALKIHKTSPIPTVALGRMLTAGSIMGAMLKNDTDILTLNIRGDGPLKGITVTADSRSRVKGYVYEPIVETFLKESGKLDLGKAIGFGTFTVIKDLGLKEPVSGQIPIISGEIADDLTYYFAKSEQVPSSVALSILLDKGGFVKKAGGFIIQLMPNASDDMVSYLENKLAHLPSLTSMLNEEKSPKEILNILFENKDIKIHDIIPTSYYCNCSREKVEKALISVGINELEDILKTDKKANLHCHFCNKDYEFNEEDLNNLIIKLKN